MRKTHLVLLAGGVIAVLAVLIFHRAANPSSPGPNQQTPVTAALPAPVPVNPAHARFVDKQNQKFLQLQSKLHLTPEQEAEVRTAMAAESKQNEALFSPVPDVETVSDTHFKSVDETLWDILTPDQAVLYEQMEEKEVNAGDRVNAKLEATAEMEQVASRLNLSDAQKALVYSALYHIQIGLRKDGLANLTDDGPVVFVPLLKAGTQAQERALAKILTPAQLAAYRRNQSQIQEEAMKEFQANSHPDAAL